LFLAAFPVYCPGPYEPDDPAMSDLLRSYSRCDTAEIGYSRLADLDGSDLQALIEELELLVKTDRNRIAHGRMDLCLAPAVPRESERFM
jgi:hypothetical protein